MSLKNFYKSHMITERKLKKTEDEQFILASVVEDNETEIIGVLKTVSKYIETMNMLKGILKDLENSNLQGYFNYEGELTKIGSNDYDIGAIENILRNKKDSSLVVGYSGLKIVEVFFYRKEVKAIIFEKVYLDNYMNDVHIYHDALESIFNNISFEDSDLRHAIRIDCLIRLDKLVSKKEDMLKNKGRIYQMKKKSVEEVVKQEYFKKYPYNDMKDLQEFLKKFADELLDNKNKS